VRQAEEFAKSGFIADVEASIEQMQLDAAEKI
jgi:hypothetical protein